MEGNSTEAQDFMAILKKKNVMQKKLSKQKPLFVFYFFVN